MASMEDLQVQLSRYKARLSDIVHSYKVLLNEKDDALQKITELQSTPCPSCEDTRIKTECIQANYGEDRAQLDLNRKQAVRALQLDYEERLQIMAEDKQHILTALETSRHSENLLHQEIQMLGKSVRDLKKTVTERDRSLSEARTELKKLKNMSSKNGFTIGSSADTAVDSSSIDIEKTSSTDPHCLSDADSSDETLHLKHGVESTTKCSHDSEHVSMSLSRQVSILQAKNSSLTLEVEAARRDALFFSSKNDQNSTLNEQVAQSLKKVEERDKIILDMQAEHARVVIVERKRVEDAEEALAVGLYSHDEMHRQSLAECTNLKSQIVEISNALAKREADHENNISLRHQLQFVIEENISLKEEVSAIITAKAKQPSPLISSSPIEPPLFTSRYSTPLDDLSSRGTSVDCNIGNLTSTAEVDSNELSQQNRFLEETIISLSNELRDARAEAASLLNDKESAIALVDDSEMRVRMAEHEATNTANELRIIRERTRMMLEEKDGQLDRLRLRFNTAEESSVTSPLPVTSAKRLTMTSTDGNHKVLETLLKENESIISKRDSTLSGGKNGHPQSNRCQDSETDDTLPSSILHVVEMQASYEEKLSANRRHRAELEDHLAESRIIEERLCDQVALLKSEIRKLERNTSRETINLEYVKNIMLKFMRSPSSKEGRRLIPVLAAVLHFSKEEIRTIS